MASQSLNILFVGSNWKGHNRTPHVFAFLSGVDSRTELSASVAATDRFPWAEFQLRRVADLPARLVFFLADVFRARGADVIYVLPMNPWALSYARFLARVGHAKLVVDYYTAALTTLEDRGGATCWAGDAAQCAERDRIVLRDADLIVAPQRSEIQVVAESLGIPAPQSRIVVIPLCCVDRGSRFEWTPGRKLRIVWWGSFSPLHGAERVLAAMAALQERRSSVTLTIVGVPGDRASTVRQIEQLAVSDCVSFRDDLSFHDSTLPTYLTTECDLALGHFGTSRKALNVVSNKIVEALSLGLPVLTGDGPGVREFLADGGALLVPQDSAHIAAAITSVLDGRTDLASIARAGNQAFRTHFSIDAFKKAFGELVDKRFVPSRRA